jgi:hypothetical protein
MVAHVLFDLPEQQLQGGATVNLRHDSKIDPLFRAPLSNIAHF